MGNIKASSSVAEAKNNNQSIFTGIIGLALLIMAIIVIVFNILIYAVIVPSNIDKIYLSERIISKSEANISAFDSLNTLAENSGGLKWNAIDSYRGAISEFRVDGNNFAEHTTVYNGNMGSKVDEFKQKCIVFLSDIEKQDDNLSEEDLIEELKDSYSNLQATYNNVRQVYGELSSKQSAAAKSYTELKKQYDSYKSYYENTLGFLAEYKAFLDGVATCTKYDNFSISLSNTDSVISDIDNSGDLSRLIEKIDGFDILADIPEFDIKLIAIPSLPQLPNIEELVKERNFDKMADFFDGGYIIDRGAVDRNVKGIISATNEVYDNYVSKDIITERVQEYANVIPMVKVLSSAMREYAYLGTSVMSYQNIIDWLSPFTWICDIVMAATVAGYAIYLSTFIIARRLKDKAIM